jgi:hypothetical protein
VILAAVLAVVVSVGSLVLAASSGQSSTPKPRRIATAAVSGCAHATTPCGSDDLDELVIHMAYEAARRALAQQSTATATTPTP